MTRRVFRTVVSTPSFHRLSQLGNDCNVCSAQQIKTQSASHPSTDCTALSAAPFEPLLFTGEVRDVAAVGIAHASWMTAMSACSESPWMSTLRCPTYRANAARLRLANASLFPFYSRGMATICLYTVSMATTTVTIGASSSVCKKQQSHWMTGVSGWFCDRDTFLFSLPRSPTQMLHQG